MLLREACLSKDLDKVKSLLKDTDLDLKEITNFAPNGSNTLLYL